MHAHEVVYKIIGNPVNDNGTGVKWLTQKQTAWLRSVWQAETDLPLPMVISGGLVNAQDKIIGTWHLAYARRSKTAQLSWSTYEAEIAREQADKAASARQTHEAAVAVVTAAKAKFAGELCEAGHDFPAPPFSYGLSLEVGQASDTDWLS